MIVIVIWLGNQLSLSGLTDPLRTSTGYASNGERAHLCVSAYTNFLAIAGV